MKEFYKEALRDLQERQQELEENAWQVEGLRNECNEAKKLQEAQVARLAELGRETRRLLEKKTDLWRQCE